MVGLEQIEERRQGGGIEGWRAGVDALHTRLAGRFARAEGRERGRRYLAGLVGRVERANGWQVAAYRGEVGPQGVPRLRNAAHWDADAVRDALRSDVVEHLGTPEAVLVIDETGFVKKGTTSVGGKRQYRGTAGRIENCQMGVFLADASERGHGCLDRALYLPQEWATDPGRRAEAGGPTTIDFATKGQLAQHMLARACAAGVPAAWVAGATVYGADGRRRRWLEEQRVEQLIAALPAGGWQRLSAGEGSHGPRWYARVRLPSARQPDMALWVRARRSGRDPCAVAYDRAFGSTATALNERVRVAGTRWAIEESFERAQGTGGLDQDEVRRWTAWYRHLTLALLAHAYLEVTRLHARAVAAVPAGEGVPAGADPAHGPRGPTAPAGPRRSTRAVHLPAGVVVLAPPPSSGGQARTCRPPCAVPDGAAPHPCAPPAGAAGAAPRRGVGPPPTADLTDHQGHHLRPLLPAQRRRAGQPPRDRRLMINAMLWVERTACSWRSVPIRFGSWQDVYARDHRWRQDGLWLRLRQTLQHATAQTVCA